MQYIPQVSHTRRAFVFWSISVAVVLALVSLIIVAPLAAASGYSEAPAGIYRAFGAVCHQLSERSFFIDGHKLAVCSRCAGLYFGFAFTLLVYPLLRSLKNAQAPARKWLFLAAVPLAIDVGLKALGLWENTHTSRLLTGALLGSMAVFYVMPGVVDLSHKKAQVRHKKGSLCGPAAR